MKRLFVKNNLKYLVNYKLFYYNALEMNNDLSKAKQMQYSSIKIKDLQTEVWVGMLKNRINNFQILQPH